MVDGVPGEGTLVHDSAADLLDAITRWYRDYARWREECGLAFVEGYPVKGWAGQAPSERRAAVLFRIANHIHGQSEVDRAWRLRRWAVQSLLDENAEAH